MAKPKHDLTPIYLKAMRYVGDDPYAATCCMITKAVIGVDVYRQHQFDNGPWWRCPERTLYARIFGFNQTELADLTQIERLLFLSLAAACWRDFVDE